MKILQVAHSFLPYTSAGTEIYAYKLSRELSKRNKLAVFFRVNNRKKKEYDLTLKLFEGLEVYEINNTFRKCGSFLETYSNKIIDAKFGSLLDEFKPDIVHIHHLMFLSCGLVNEAKQRNIPVVLTLHDHWLFCYRGQLIDQDMNICKGDSVPKCENCLKYLLRIKKSSLAAYYFLKTKRLFFLIPFLKKIYFFAVKKDNVSGISDFRENARKIFSEVDLFIAPSRFFKDEFVKRGIPRDKIIYSPYGFDLNKSVSFPKNEFAGLRFGYLGTLLPMKGIDILIKAFKEINDPNARLLIFGKIFSYAGFESYPRILKRMVNEDQRIRLMGGYDNNDIVKIASGFDMLVAPSIWPENAPLVIQEAFMAETPVIASRIGGIPELINDGANGLLFNPGDVKDLKEKMEYIINNPEIIRKFRDNMPKIKSIEENAKEMEEIYVKLIDHAAI